MPSQPSDQPSHLDQQPDPCCCPDKSHPNTHKSHPDKFYPHNRIYDLMLHTTRYAFKGCTRLAQDAGVSKSAVSRLLNGRSNPSCRLLTVVFKAIEKQLRKEKKIKQALPLRELISLDDSYPTDSICRLIGCTGCFLSQGAFHRQDAFHREQQ